MKIFMAIYLNSINPYENYKSLYRSKYFVDKSLVIDKLNEVIETSDKYMHNKTKKIW